MAFVQREALVTTPYSPDFFGELSTEDIERRRLNRKTCSAAGIIHSPELSLPVPCIVRDMSPTGARLEIRDTGDVPASKIRLPQSFRLELRLDRIEVACVVRWRRGPEIGVRLLTAPQPISRITR